MNKIQNAFLNGKAFIGFVTGGDPSMDASEKFILAMAKAGADIVEIGVPFSDPIAEGEVIQASNLRALDGGATLGGIFGLVRRVRAKAQVPLVLLTYLNPVFRRGYAEFFAECAESGVDGVIIPDLPFEEQPELKGFARERGVALISMVSPTSDSRIEAIAREADGFLYVVSSMGVTGVRSEISGDLGAMLARAREASGVPLAVGFGVNTPVQAAQIAQCADGVIVGSAIVRLVEKHGIAATKYIESYVREMKAAVKSAD